MTVKLCQLLLPILATIKVIVAAALMVTITILLIIRRGDHGGYNWWSVCMRGRNRGSVGPPTDSRALNGRNTLGPRMRVNITPVWTCDCSLTVTLATTNKG